MKHYPPMKALLAFEVSVRLGSFLKAAEELHVTPGAVGQQIKKLEERLGVILFTRGVRRLTVTASGKEYYRLLAPALQQIAAAGKKIEEAARRRFTISMPPGFAAQWFSPRMPAFIARFPDIDLRLNATAAVVSLEQDDVDLAIRHFDGRGALGKCQLLVEDECWVYCRPDYLVERKIQGPDDLSKATLLHTTMFPDWEAWLQEHTAFSLDEIEAQAGIHFDQTLLAIEAAKRGQGMMICIPLLLEEALCKGELIRAFPFSYRTGKGFYLTLAQARRKDSHLHEICQWLANEITEPAFS